MTRPVVSHEDVAGYVFGILTPEERAAFEQHLSGCPSCQALAGELGAPAELVRSAAPRYDTPPDLEAKVVAAVERGAAEDGRRPTATGRRPLWRRPVTLAAAAAVVIAAAFLTVGLLDRASPGGMFELEAVLAPPGGGPAQATVVVEKTGIGREISFRSDDLPILPKGEYYELWFVGPGDTLQRPNRISAGTFHPDDDGRSLVELTAAVDPALYFALSVTAEPADGNPQRTGPEVLRTP